MNKLTVSCYCFLRILSLLMLCLFLGKISVVTAKNRAGKHSCYMPEKTSIITNT